MKIDNSLILKLEHLARLSLNNEERETIRKDLDNILIMVEKLHELETKGVEPLKYITEDYLPPRKDNIDEDDIKEEALMLSPKRVNGFFAIPKVIDKK